MLVQDGVDLGAGLAVGMSTLVVNERTEASLVAIGGFLLGRRVYLVGMSGARPARRLPGLGGHAPHERATEEQGGQVGGRHEHAGSS